MEVKAINKGVRSSDKKVSELLGKIRGRTITQALTILAFSKQDCALPISKTLKSAVANAVNNNGMKIEDLFVSKSFSNQAKKLKQIRFASRGRVARIAKPTVNLTIAVAEKSTSAGKVTK